MYCLLRVVQATIKPPIKLALAVMFKRLIIGNIPPGPRPTSGKAAFDVWCDERLRCCLDYLIYQK